MRRHEFYCEEHPFVDTTEWWYNYIMYYVLDSLEEIGFTVDDINFSTAFFKKNGYEISIAFKDFSYIMEVKLPNGSNYLLGFAMAQNNGIIVEPNSMVYVHFINGFYEDTLHFLEHSSAFKQCYKATTGRGNVHSFYFSDFISYLCGTYFMNDTTLFKDIAFALAQIHTDLVDLEWFENPAFYTEKLKNEYELNDFHYYKFKWNEGETTNYLINKEMKTKVF